MSIVSAIEAFLAIQLFAIAVFVLFCRKWPGAGLYGTLAFVFAFSAILSGVIDRDPHTTRVYVCMMGVDLVVAGSVWLIGLLRDPKLQRK